MSIKKINVANLFILTALILFGGFVTIASAQINYPLSNPIPLNGYMWSGYSDNNEGIGWVSMHCANNSSCASNGGVDYGVELKENGDVEGYTWSSNVGWVQFGDLSGMPDNSGNARLDINGNLLGWARVISGADANDGWDGWIKLNSGNTWGVKFDLISGEAVTSPSNTYSWAWGGDTISGWLDFSQVAFGEVPDQSTDVDLIVANATYSSTGSVDRVNGRFGTMRFPMTLQNIGSASTDPDEAVTWQMDLNDQRTGVVDNNLQSSEPGPISGGGVISAQASINNFLYGVYDVDIEVNYGQTIGEDNYNNNTLSRTFTIRPPDPQMEVTAERDIIRSGDKATITWDTTAIYPMDCEITGPGVSHSFDPSTDGPTGSVETTERFNASIYSMVCNEPITDTTFTSNQMRVEVVPQIQEI